MHLSGFPNSVNALPRMLEFPFSQVNLHSDTKCHYALNKAGVRGNNVICPVTVFVLNSLK